MKGGKRTVLLGHIATAHGIKGEVAIRTYTTAPGDIASYGPLASDDGSRTFRITSVRVAAKGVIARIAGIEDRTAAEKLRGIGLVVDRDRLPEPEDGAFYHEDLIGLAAVDATGHVIGSIVAIHNFGAGDLVEVRLDDRRETEMVAFTDACVPKVDVSGGRVTIILPASAETDHETPPSDD